MKKTIFYIALAGLLVVFGSCQKELPNQPKPNTLPSTRMWIASENDLKETVSRQHVYFYGEDADGFISGFLIATGKFSPKLTQLPNPDNLAYSWTTKNDTVVALPLLAKRDSFTIIVRAVDNHFPSTAIPVGAVVRGFPNPYWDRDTSGAYNSGDLYLTALTQAIDPKGAIQLFPIINTPPKVQFGMTPGDSPITVEQPETTFTVTTFAWVGSDDDGNQTIKSYRFALNDTTNASNWFELPASTATRVLKTGEADSVKVTFYVKRQDSDNAGATVDAEVYTGLFGNLQFKGKVKNLTLNAENVLYLQARDVAGEYSPAVRMPSAPTGHWYVRKPQGKMLVIGDYPLTGSNRPYIIDFYRRRVFSETVTPSILGGQLKNFDVFGFDRAKPNNYLNYLNPAFIKTLQLYDLVLWFTDITPNISAAQIGLFYYTNTLNPERNTYGHVIFTTQYQNSPTYDDLRKYNDFAPLDSITNDPQYGFNRLPVKDSTTNINTQVLPLVSGYPILYTDSVTTGGSVLSPTGQHTVFFKRLYKRTDSQYIYKLDSSRVAQPGYKGQLEIGIIDNQKRFVMMGLPLHLLNGWQHTLPQFFKQVIEVEFGLQ